MPPVERDLKFGSGLVAVLERPAGMERPPSSGGERAAAGVLAQELERRRL